MDELLQRLINIHNLTNNEALVVIGIMGMVAYDNQTPELAFDIVDEKLKTIAKRTLAMA